MYIVYSIVYMHTFTVMIDAADSTKRIASAYQVTRQCMEMAAEVIYVCIYLCVNLSIYTYIKILFIYLHVYTGALLISPNLGSCAIDPTFIAFIYIYV
jgi:hypothetical protein